MSKARRAALCAAAASCAGMGGFVAASFGDGEQPITQRTVTPAMRTSDARQARMLAARRARKPKLTHLITTSPVPVAANQEIVAELRCKRRQGIPLDGGAIAPPAPAEVAVSVLSRFNPNTLSTPPRSYFVGVRNLGDSASSFRATLVCAKGIKQ